MVIGKKVGGACCGGGCDCGSNCDCGVGKCGHSDFAKKILMTLLGVLMVYGIFYVGTLMRNNLKKFDYIGYADQMERTINVNGYGKVTGNNDIAVTSIGYSNVDKDVTKAQVNNKKVMDQVMADLKSMKVEDADLQTNYTIYPEYNYSNLKGQELVGYRITNTLTIKIRDLKKIPDILNLAGKYGANSVGGLSFTIDDPENLKAQARDKALADAKVKAAKLADSLGVRVVAVVSYSEYESGGYQPTMYSDYKMAEGGGGGPSAVASGSNDVIMNVNVVYKILP